MKEATSVALTVTKKYDAAYDTGNQQWVPPCAEFEILLQHESATDIAAARSLEIELASGPAGNYRYFPFSSAIYIGDRCAAIVEFSKPFEHQRVAIDLPVGMAVTLTIVSEQSRPPSRDGDQRHLAVMLIEMRAGESRASFPESGANIVPQFSILAQKRIALLEEFPQPVFVVGPYRSGTSILTWALGQHPNVWPLPETNFLALLGAGAVAGYWMGAHAPRSFFDLCDISIDEYLAHQGASIDDFMKKATMRRFDRHRHERMHPKAAAPQQSLNVDFELARTLFGAKQRWVDGTPEHASHMGLLRRLFPAAKFVCTVRNPVDVIASMVNFKNVGGLKHDINEATEMWRRLTRSTLLGARAFGSKAVTFVSYEEITAQPNAVLSNVFDFLGEPRFPKSADCYDHRINSSNLSEEEREAHRTQIARHLSRTDLPKIYDEVRSMVGATFDADEAALSQIEASHFAFIESLLRGAFPHLKLDPQ